MKYIKQKSTQRAIHREIPHTDTTIIGASRRYGVDINDLEVAEEDWSEQDWINNILTYSDKRKSKYPAIPDQLDYIYHNGIEKWKADMILPVKEKYPKGAN